MKEYLKAQNKTTDAIISNIFTTDELNRFSKSDYRWADNRTKQYRHRATKKGEIYQFEFGKNFQPEMSYEHRGLIIGVIPPSSDTYKKIEELVLQKYFPDFIYEYTQIKQKLSDTETALQIKEEELKSLSTY